jgi:carbon-monoxide dehydrogenase large subunit
MEKFGRSQPVRRVEDVRFLSGNGRFLEDIAPKGALVASVFRSPVAHAEITALDVSEARQSEGVHLVVTAADLEAAAVRLHMKTTVVTNRDGTKGAEPLRPILAKGRVRYVGEALAVVVAETLEQARDAAEVIEFDYDELEPHVAPVLGGPDLHGEAPGNLAFDWGLGDEEACTAALAASAHVVTLEVPDNRIVAASLEPRGCYAEMEGDRLHVAVNAQGVWEPKRQISANLGLDPEMLRVTNPDTGGGFGMKAMVYPETLAVAHAARTLGRPVRWMSDRSEAFLSDNAGRDLVSTATLGFDQNLKITAYKVETLANMGAYNSQFAQNIQTNLFSRVLPGVYDIQTTWLNVKGVFTNTNPVDAYRGAGRPEAIYVLERLMDRAARELGVDPWELRRRNFIPRAAFPYKAATGETYDVGDFARVLARVEAEADLAGFAARRSASEAAGRLRGLGLCYYIESILGSPEEEATVEFNEDGSASLFVGTQSNGQGHETVYARFLADQTGIPPEKVRIIQGDSDRIASGGGTGGSRSVTVQNNATLATVEAMIPAYQAFLAGEMGVEPEAVAFDDESFRAKGSNLTPSFLEAAALARAAGRADLLKFTRRVTLPARSFPNGAHVAEVEVDPETGVSKVVRYTVTDDFGHLINPLLVEGQVHGGIAQGLGQALYERVVHDADGQLLTASFMDYQLPRAQDIPVIRFTTEPTPSTANAMGMKGCGEAGTVGSLAAVANAMQDALWARGVRRADMPFTPERVWRMLNETGEGDA